MAEIEYTDDRLVVRVTGADKVWALKSHLEIPLEHVSGAAKDEDAARAWFHGIKAPGTNIPGVIVAGTFYSHGDRVFWDVHHPERAIAISLHDERFAKLVVEVDDPDAAITELEARLHGRGS